MNIRCSSLPLFLTCPSSALPVERDVRPHAEAGNLGWMVHQALAALVTGGDIPGPKGHAVDPEEYAMLVNYGRQAWNELGQSMPHPTVEVKRSAKLADRSWGPVHIDGAPGFSLSGTADVYSAETATVLDWKSGRKQADFWPQLMGYALLFQAKVIALVWLREREAPAREVGETEMRAFRERLLEACAEVGRTYHPGNHCEESFCRRLPICEARHEWARTAVVEIEKVAVQAISRSDFLRLYPKAVALKAILARFEQALREEVRAHGPLQVSAEEEIALVETDRRDVDPLKAWPILSATLNDDEKAVARCVTLSLGAMEAAVKAIAPETRGKGKAWAQFLATLTDAGALTTRRVTQLKRRRLVQDEPTVTAKEPTT